jgi:hypothetical protein
MKQSIYILAARLDTQQHLLNQRPIRPIEHVIREDGFQTLTDPPDIVLDGPVGLAEKIGRRRCHGAPEKQPGRGAS